MGLVGLGEVVIWNARIWSAAAPDAAFCSPRRSRLGQVLKKDRLKPIHGLA
jgi:hypothetical protein